MKNRLALFLILAIASFLRFYNLLFDAPHFFNPDERNMANAIVQLRMPTSLRAWPKCIGNELWKKPEETIEEGQRPTCNLHPHFFAYGQFPLYLAFFSDQLATRFTLNIPFQPTTNNQQPITDYSSAIFWLRFWSALSSVGTVFVVYLITKRLILCHPEVSAEGSRPNTGFLRDSSPSTSLSVRMTPLVAALLAAFTPGLIQSAHFGTTESLLTFFFLTSVYLSLKMSSRATGGSVAIPTDFRIPAGLLLRQPADRNDDDSEPTTNNQQPITLFLLACVCGLAIGTKLTGLFCLVPAGMAAMVQLFQAIRMPTQRIRRFLKPVALWLIFLGLTIGVTIAASPYNLVDVNGFKGSVFGYEKEVATGEQKVFYTRQFAYAIPLLFQMEKIFPYALGLPLFIFGLAGFIFVIGNFLCQIVQALWKGVSSRLQAVSSKQSKDEAGLSAPAEDSQLKKESTTDNQRSITDGQLLTANCQLFILIISFLIYLIPNSSLYAKWTRFLTPVFPFFAIFTALFFQQLYQALSSFQSNIRGLFSIFHFAFCILAILPGFAFFSIYLRDDVRVTASRWIYATIPDRSYILFDTGNVIDIPLGLPAADTVQPRPNYTLISFDFYHLEENPELLPKLLTHLESADYIFIPSRRIFANHLPRADEFPTAAAYYRHLFDGSLGFEEVARFSSFPALGPLQFPDEIAEETSTVFDHPVIRIYKKTRVLTKEEYVRLLRDNGSAL